VGRVVNFTELCKLAQRAHEEKQLVVMTGGYLDLFHVGHLDLLKAARKMGTVLIHEMGSDGEARRLKGPPHPVIPEAHRAEIAAEFCDAVILINSPEDKARVITTVKPDIYVRGAEYASRQFPEMPFLAQYGGRCVVHDKPDREHTSAIIRRIAQVST